MTQQTEDSAPATVLYDGSCPLCRAEIGFARQRSTSGSLEFRDVSANAAGLPEGLTRKDALARFHVVGPDGTLHDGPEAFAIMWSRIPLLRPLAWLIGRRWMRGPAELAYRAFLRVRPSLQRLASRRVA